VVFPYYSSLSKEGSTKYKNWGDSQERASLSLQSLLSQAPVLRMPDFSKPFILQTDASNVGLGDALGDALCQEHDGDIFQIAYASKKRLDRETRYSVIERECLGIVWRIGKYKVYLYGQHFFLQNRISFI